MENIETHVESLIFSTEVPLRRERIKECLLLRFGQAIEDADLEDILEQLQRKYNSVSYSFEIVEIDEAFCFMTKAEFFDTVSSLIRIENKSKLTRVALETLSIIAYKQPVSKPIIESIRGVNCDYTLQKLLEKELIEIAGRGDGPGRPLVYKTSQRFMDYFGLKSIQDLPKLKDLKEAEEEIGKPSELEIVDLDKIERDGNR